MEQNERYIWTTREVQIENVLNNGHIEDARAVVICVEDKLKGIKLPHPITHFIRQTYTFKGVSLSAQLNPAREICKFLNFINEQISENQEEFTVLKNEGIPGLQLVHGARYISFLTNKRGKNNEPLVYGYVKRIERYLTSFYKYLSEMGIINEIKFNSYIDHRNKQIIVSPFDNPKFGTIYPSTKRKVKKHKLKDFGNEPEKRDQMVVEFFKVAEVVCPDIAFGIALQIFGGLRRGEVVNITKNSIPTNFLNGENHIIVDDNQEKLFGNRKSLSKSQVKKPRIQFCFQSDLLREMYNNHLIGLKSQKNKNNKYAFFVNTYGEPISGDLYEKRFDLVKKKYIEKLRVTTGRYGDFKLLDDSIWGTHIGRGIFTNYLFELGLSDKQMAIARGDSSTESANAYIDKRNALADFQSAMNTLSKVDYLYKNTTFEVE